MLAASFVFRVLAALQLATHPSTKQGRGDTTGLQPPSRTTFLNHKFILKKIPKTQ